MEALTVIRLNLCVAPSGTQWVALMFSLLGFWWSELGMRTVLTSRVNECSTLWDRSLVSVLWERVSVVEEDVLGRPMAAVAEVSQSMSG